MALVLTNTLAFFMSLLLILRRGEEEKSLNNSLMTKDIECIKSY
jgi:hypothetical protein